MASSVGIIGGTGPEGRGLAARLALAGVRVFIGSRVEGRGREAAGEVAALSGRRVEGGANEEAARRGEAVIVTVPYSAQHDTMQALEDAIGDKVVISAVVPLQFSRSRVSLLDLEPGSAAEEMQLLLPRARVAGAFHNLSASHLIDTGRALDGDVIVCSDHPDALRQAIELTDRIEGLRGVNGGPLAGCRYVEGLTALLLTINRIHRAETHIKVVGI